MSYLQFNLIGRLLADPFVGTFQKNWSYHEVTVAL